MIDWLNSHSGAVQAITTAILVVITALYARFTAVMSTEMRRAREAELRPIVVMEPDSSSFPKTIDEAQASYADISVILKNVGPGPAIDVHTMIRSNRQGSPFFMANLGIFPPNHREPDPTHIQIRLSDTLDSVVCEVGYFDLFGVRWITRCEIEAFEDIPNVRHLMNPDVAGTRAYVPRIVAALRVRMRGFRRRISRRRDGPMAK